LGKCYKKRRREPGEGCHRRKTGLYWAKERGRQMETEVSGYCRTFNQHRIAECVVEMRDGKAEILQMDCNYEKCLNRSGCQLVLQALEEAGK